MKRSLFSFERLTNAAIAKFSLGGAFYEPMKVV